MATKPDPAAVDDAGAPMYIFTFLLGLVVRAQLSLITRIDFVDLT